MGAVAGAGTIGLVAFLVPVGIMAGDWVIPLAGSGGGLLGSFVDSVLGAAVQAHWRDAGGDITEKRPRWGGSAVTRVSGVGWVNNDAVNGMASLSGAALAVILAALAG
jgi:uncharacterized membrane protein